MLIGSNPSTTAQRLLDALDEHIAEAISYRTLDRSLWA